MFDQVLKKVDGIFLFSLVLAAKWLVLLVPILVLFPLVSELSVGFVVTKLLGGKHVDFVHI